jgi:hypothetical protein
LQTDVSFPSPLLSSSLLFSPLLNLLACHSVGDAPWNLYDSMNIIDDRSVVNLGIKTLMPIWFVPGQHKYSDANQICSSSVPRSNAATETSPSCAHVCSVEEVNSAAKGGNFKNEACGWTDDTYTCATTKTDKSPSWVPATQYEPVTGVYSVTTRNKNNRDNGLGVCAWQRTSGVYCCANTIRSEKEDGDVIETCSDLNIEKEEDANHQRFDNDTITGTNKDWKELAEKHPSTMLKEAIAKTKKVVTYEAVKAAEESSKNIDTKNGPKTEAIKEIENVVGAMSTGSATGSSATGNSATGNSATGNSATGISATGTSGSNSATGASLDGTDGIDATGIDATGSSLLDLGTKSRLRKRRRLRRK